MKHLAVLALVLSLGTATGSHAQLASGAEPGEAAVVGGQPFSALYQRVDRSFSSIAVDTPFGAVRESMREIRTDGCEQYGECSWSDPDDVEHFFWPSIEDETNRDRDVAVVKVVRAERFQGRPIGALGIGLARDKPDVLANIRRFVPEIEIDCDRQASGNVGPDECGGTVLPGWFQVGFDRNGQLEAVRFDAYHFT